MEPRDNREIDAAKKAERIAKLQAWKEKQQQMEGGEQSNGKSPSGPLGKVEERDTAAPPPLQRAQEAAAALAAKIAAAPAEDDDVDPLDAFMAEEVLPEVKAKEEEERKQAEEESKKLQELLKVRNIYSSYIIILKYD